MLQGSVLFSVIVPFRNAAAHLPRCLSALGAQTCTRAEYILVDNGSSDDSTRIVSSFAHAHPNLTVRLEHEERPGPSAARNRGAAVAAAPWLVFTDADCIPDCCWLADLLSAIARNPDVAGFAGCILPFPGSNAVGRLLGLYTLPPNPREQLYSQYSPVYGGGFPAANMCIRCDVFREVGGFAVKLRTGEDHKLCADLYRLGHSVLALTTAKVLHNHRGSVGGLLRQAYGFGRAHGFCMRYLAAPACVLQTPVGDLRFETVRFPVWLDLNQADKKVLGCAALGILWHPLGGLVLLYLFYIMMSNSRRAGRYGIRVRCTEAPLFALLLILKSAALTAGRIAGSIIHRVLCI